MSKPLTRKEACEAYEHRWQRSHLTEPQWRDVLDLLYDGKGATEIVRTLKLDPTCMRSLGLHAKEHRGYITFMRGVRLKDKRLQVGGTMSEMWRALIEKVFAIAMDESTKPGVLVKAAAVAQKEMADLQRLAQSAIEEFQREEREHDGKVVADVQDMVQKIAADVFGIRPRHGQ